TAHNSESGVQSSESPLGHDLFRISPAQPNRPGGDFAFATGHLLLFVLTSARGLARFCRVSPFWLPTSISHLLAEETPGNPRLFCNPLYPDLEMTPIVS